jgi:hypothetical protein
MEENKSQVTSLERRQKEAVLDQEYAAHGFLPGICDYCMEKTYVCRLKDNLLCCADCEQLRRESYAR